MSFFDNQIEKIIKEHISSIAKSTSSEFTSKYAEESNIFKFLTHLNKKFISFGRELEPFVNGRYMIFMEHGTWFHTAQDLIVNSDVPPTFKYISDLDANKIRFNILNYSPLFSDQGNRFNYTKHLNLSSYITDITLPELSKEYTSISTRQKNAFINTRTYDGSDFSLSWLERDELDIIRYHEIWHKMIELYRDGVIFTPESESGYDNNPYLIPNPYANRVWVIVLDNFNMDLRALISLFGVMPVNFNLQNIIGNRGQGKLTNYNLNYKFMDLQYAFYDGWDALIQSSKNIEDIKHSEASLTSNLASEFYNFLEISKTAF